VTIFVNGKAIDPSQPSTATLGSLNAATFGSFLKGMSAWGKSGNTSSAVKLWTARRQ
jgi:hypothetical protein